MSPARRAWLHRLARQMAGVAGLAHAHSAHSAQSVLSSQSAPSMRSGPSAAAGGTLPPSITPPDPGIQRGRTLVFPRDHGAHPATRTEWWYVTGWLGPEGDSVSRVTHGFQVTFFRSKVAGAREEAASAPPGAAGTTSAAGGTGRFAPRHLLFAHAAVTDLRGGRHLHAQRIARWNGDPAVGPDRASTSDAEVHLARWRLSRDAATPWQASTWRTDVRAEGFAMRGTLQSAQPPLLQGDAGFSRKGPEERQASHYYSLPQLDARLALEIEGQRLALRGRAWLDQEWSDELLHPQAVGWDWIGMNLFDGSALTAFRLRRADGSALWAGGSVRGPGAGASPRSFQPGEVVFEPGRAWRSASTNALYPVSWFLRTPAGRHTVRALLDAQELDGRSGTGAIYWEGLAELLDERGQRVGLGYLEMTGYAAPIKLG